MFGPRRLSSLTGSFLGLLLLPFAASAIDFLGGQIQIHGYAQESFRMMSDHFNLNSFYVSQWATALDLELEGDLAPNGFGPFSQAKIYLRGLVQYDCVYTKLCGLSRSYDLFGDRAARAAPNFTNGRTPGYTGALPDPENPSVPVQPNGRFTDFTTIPPFSEIFAIGGGAARPAVERTLGLVLNERFAIKNFGGTLGPQVLPMGPWNTGVYIQPIGALQDIPNVTPPLPLRPLVPNAPPEFYGSNPQGLYVPSAALLAIHNQFESFDQNFTQSQLAWNRGASQDTYEFKEGYLDLEMLDGRLWFRLGKQDVVWGKTELFRNQDQINPVDLGQTTLGSLKDTRIPLWLARAVYSFYNVGPLEDVRLEYVANLGNFMPNDLGRCGEPYTIFLVCGKSAALVAHGLFGITLGGEIRPPSVWDKLDGLQTGARLEFRWDRFSFALSDYYGYDYFPTPNNFNTYSRNVDPLTGAPLDSLNRPYALGTPGLARQALLYNAGNRQFFDVFCSATVGLASGLVPLPGLNLSNECAFTLFSSQQKVLGLFPIATAFGIILANEGGGGQTFLNLLVGLIKPGLTAPTLVPLNPAPGKVAGGGLNSVLTTPQQALLGCGPFYGTNCQLQGIDLFNTEASVLMQSFPQFEFGGPVATRFVNGHLYTLPGACGPVSCYGRTYNPQVDGCLNASFPGCAGSPSNLLAFNPGGGKPIISFSSVMAALSYNFLQTLTIISFATDKTGTCNVNNPLTCSLVTGFVAATGTQRPDVTVGGNGAYGRRDFLWLSGSEINLQYPKHNILGFGMDFAEDQTKTNWGVEFSWTNAETLQDNNSFSGFSTHGIEQLTISMDRPTFVNFLNPNRTLFFNTQWFFRYINNFHDNSAMWVNGPFAMLATFTINTGYFQDRLLPEVTFVHDVRTTSGAALISLTYRYSQAFSATLGTNVFYGSPQKMQLPIQQPVLQDNGGDFMNRVKYDGLTSLAERNELSLVLRYTF
jgi:Protein of unknown function (DUF1302)